MFFLCKIVQIFSEKMHKIQGSMGCIEVVVDSLQKFRVYSSYLLTIIIHYNNGTLWRVNCHTRIICPQYNSKVLPVLENLVVVDQKQATHSCFTRCKGQYLSGLRVITRIWTKEKETTVE